MSFPPPEGPPVTKTGRILTDADIEELADEAERGYDVSHLKDKPNRRGRPAGPVRRASSPTQQEPDTRQPLSTGSEPTDGPSPDA